MEWKGLGPRQNNFKTPQTPVSNASNHIPGSIPAYPHPYVSPFTSPLQSQSSMFDRPLLPPSAVGNGPGTVGTVPGELANDTSDIAERYSYYLSLYPLFCSDWSRLSDTETDCIALSSYKEGFTNKIHILHGIKYGKEATEEDYEPIEADDTIEGFDFHKVSETDVEYPVTNLQWDPSMCRSASGLNERLAASSEVLRLYKVDHDTIDKNNDYLLVQTHYLTNSTTGGKPASPTKNDIMTCPPVTSFDWNKSDNSLIITSSVDTTCTLWDLNRSSTVIDGTKKSDTACVKTQLIAHDSEVFDVKFLNDSTNLFASVGNDGRMRVFDLRSLEHSTIIYEPPSSPLPSSTTSSSSTSVNRNLVNTTYNSKALLKLATSSIDQNYLATVGVNSNQVIIIDTRMPGVPVATLDGSFGGMSSASINSIRWHPNSNFLLTGGDDCQALVWDCNNLYQLASNGVQQKEPDHTFTMSTPVLAYQEALEVNNVCWRANKGDWMGVVSGKGFQAVSI